MNSLLVRLMLIAALTQLGISLSTFRNCRSRSCFIRFEKAARTVLRVDWKPLIVFPNEAKQF
jgi:hypothetical protein